MVHRVVSTDAATALPRQLAVNQPVGEFVQPNAFEQFPICCTWPHHTAKWSHIGQADMKRNRLFILSAIASTATMFCLNSAAYAGEPVVAEWELDPDRVEWGRISLQASKYFITATAEMDLAIVRSECLDLWEPTAGRPVMAGQDSAVLNVVSHALGINSQIAFLMDARSGAALQYQNLESGRRTRQRTYRYTDEGASVWTRQPNAGEENAPLVSWPEADGDVRLFPLEARGEKIIDPTGLLYIIAASDIAVPGDSLEMVIFVRRKAARLVVVAEKFVSLEEVIGGNLPITKLVGSDNSPQALLLQLKPQPVTGSEDTKFEFLGLNRDIAIWLDPKTRLPLRVRGKAKIVGEVTFELQAAELVVRPADTTPTECNATS